MISNNFPRLVVGLFLFSFLNLYASNVYADDSVIIPNWIKASSGLWANDKLNDEDFTNSFEYLIENKMIRPSQSFSEIKSNNSFPNWLKEPVGWWAKDRISNQDFIKSMDYLVSKKIITIAAPIKQTCPNVVISFDKESYSIDEAFYLTIKSPHANKNTQRQDMIHVSVSSAQNDLPSMGVPYWETGDNTGIFRHMGGLEPHFELEPYGISWITSIAPNSLIASYKDTCTGKQHQITANITDSTFKGVVIDNLPEEDVGIDNSSNDCRFCISRYETTNNDLIISHVEITQAIQDKQNSVPLVEGKNTWIRVYVDNHLTKGAELTMKKSTKNISTLSTVTLSSQTTIPKVLGTISLISASGLSTQTLNIANPSITSYNGAISIMDESFDSKRKDPNKTLNFKLPHSWTLNDEIKIKIEINPKNSEGHHPVKESDYINNVYPSLKLNFHKTKPLEINYHPTTVKADWCEQPTLSDLENILNEFTMKIFPVSEYKIKMDSSLSRDNILGANFYGGTFLEVTLEWEQCKNYPKACAFGPSPPNIEFALVCKPSPDVPLSNGMGFKSKAWAYPNPETVAHELAHARGLGHTPIDPKDFWDTQIDSDTFQTKIDQWTITCSDSKPTNPIIGEWLEDEGVPINPNLHRPSIAEYGFDGKNVYPPEIYSDVMSYCGTVGPDIQNEGNWISPYTYKKLLDKFLIN